MHFFSKNYNNFFCVTRKSCNVHICIIWPCVPLSSLDVICSDRLGILRGCSIRKFPANLQNILFSFSSNWSHLYLSSHDSRNFRSLLVGVAAGIEGVALISWSCFPPKKELSELWPGFRLDISTNCILQENEVEQTRKATILHPTMHFISSRTQTFTCRETA